MTYPEIQVWGDSLARGVVYHEEKGRYAISHERCTTRLQDTLGCKVENHSLMGATAPEGLKQFKTTLGVPRALCAVEFGGNDCDLNWAYVAQHPTEFVTAKVPLDVFEATLTEFVGEIRKRDMMPMLVTPLPLHAERYYCWVSRGLDAEAILQALGDVNHIYRWQERYAIAVRNVARATHSRLLDLRDVMLARRDYEQLMCLDGIHPNDAGHKLLAEAVLELAHESHDNWGCVAAKEALEAHTTAIPSAAKVS